LLRQPNLTILYNEFIFLRMLASFKENQPKLFHNFPTFTQYFVNFQN